MKRLNPETGKPFKRGDMRSDGFLFSCYNYYKPWITKDGFFFECWLSPEKFKKQQDNQKMWRKNNPHKTRAYKAQRKSAKDCRTPKWLTKEHYIQIECVYAEAKRLTDETGIVHHVDHIIPLRGKLVSGLHVPWNLRAIPATENISKSNRLIDKDILSDGV